MIPTESKTIAFDLPERPTAGNDGVANAATPSASEQKRTLLPSVRWLEGANPAWDNLWIDLGGEG
jgi:hypothetical protein